jgi:cytoplasmic iron level regulating protein YaaA (DUF328/UPF0246 family)
MIMILSACSAKKDDSIQIDSPSSIVSPAYYLSDREMISALFESREQVFQNPKAKLGFKRAYAFDIYVRTGRAYKDLNIKYYDVIKKALVGGQGIEWFFLSGGFGIIHALEEAWKYQATFNRTIASQNDIPFTANLWKTLLPALCDSAISRLSPEWIYVFGSRDYTKFIKKTNAWKQSVNILIFESTGYPGPTWLSGKIAALMDAFLSGNVMKFNECYDRFNKQ